MTSTSLQRFVIFASLLGTIAHSAGRTLFFLKSSRLRLPLLLSLDLACVSTVNVLMTQMAFTSRVFRRFVSARQLLRQRKARKLMKMMATRPIEVAMAHLVSVGKVA